MSQNRKTDYGIRGYDPEKVKQLVTERERFDCPHCWGVFYSKSARTAHRNKEHWALEKANKNLRDL